MPSPQPEEWRDIPGYEGLYQVSSLGRVKSLAKPMFYGTTPNVRNHESAMRIERIMTPRVKRNGYAQIGLYQDGKAKSYTIHRLVAIVFIPNPNGFPYVNHKDEDRLNNSVDNLEWCTPSYNIHYGTAIKKLSDAKRNHPAMSKPVLQFNLDGTFVAEYPSANEAARMTGIKQGNISSCCNRTTKSTNGFIWRYKTT